MTSSYEFAMKNSMNLKKIGKISLLIGAGLAGLLAIGFVLILFILPSSYKIKESLKLRSKKETVQSTVKQSQDSMAEVSEKRTEDTENVEIDMTPAGEKKERFAIGF